MKASLSLSLSSLPCALILVHAAASAKVNRDGTVHSHATKHPRPRANKHHQWATTLHKVKPYHDIHPAGHQLFEEFKVAYNRSYEVEEEPHRFGVFLENLEAIERHNAGTLLPPVWGAGPNFALA